MTLADARSLAEAKRQLPQMALRLGSRKAVREEFLRQYPDLMPILGESYLGRWIWETLRQHQEAFPEDGGQLPLFGQFGDQIRTRDDWTEDDYRAYYGRYSNAATRNAAKRRVLAADFERRFGHHIEEEAA